MRLVSRLLILLMAAVMVPIIAAGASIYLAARMTHAKSMDELVTSTQSHMDQIRGYVNTIKRAADGQLPSTLNTKSGDTSDVKAPSGSRSRAAHLQSVERHKSRSSASRQSTHAG